MTEITEKLLQVLIDCQEVDIPSARVIQLMASEIMRMRSYGAMIPEPSPELKQRSVMLLRGMNKDPVIEATFKRLSTLLQPKVGIDSYEAIKDALLYIVADTPLSEDDANWVEIELDLLKRAELSIHDAIGFGKSHSHHKHNNSLIVLRKYIENSGGSFTTMVPKKFLEEMLSAIADIVYGKNYSMASREELQEKIRGVIEASGQEEKAEEIPNT